LSWVFINAGFVNLGFVLKIPNVRKEFFISLSGLGRIFNKNTNLHDANEPLF
jgi:hypothetical protein